MKKNLTNSEDNRRDWHGEIPRKTYGTGGLVPLAHGFKVLAEAQEVGKFITEQAPYTTNGVPVRN